MEPKLQRGFRVEILSRVKVKGIGANENSEVGFEAIIADISFDLTTEPQYSLYIMKNDGVIRFLKWYEESTLQLICYNVNKGEKLIEKFSKKTFTH